MTDALVGVGFALASAACYDAGYLLEKGALSRVPSLTSGRGVVGMLAASPQWVGGAAAMLLGLVLRFAALTLAPVGVVQPVLVGGTVAIVPLARLCLGERVTRHEAAAIATLSAGVIAVAIGAAGGDGVAVHPADDPALLLMLGTAVLVGVVLRGGVGEGRTRAAGVVCVGLCYGTGAIAEKGVALDVSRRGLVAGLRASLSSADPWLFVAATAVGLVLFQLALQRQPVSVLVPATNGLSSAWAVVGAVVVFSEHWPHAAGARMALACGYASLTIGVLILHRLGGATRLAAPEPRMS